MMSRIVLLHLLIRHSVFAVEWHCQFKVTATDASAKFCYQYYTRTANATGGQINYCCDRSGYYCKQEVYPTYNPNHVVQGSELAGSLTSRIDGTGSDRPTYSAKGVCGLDKTRVFTKAGAASIPECGNGNSDPLDPSYCEVFTGAVCLPTGHCGVGCGEGSYGGLPPDFNCHLCPAGTWSDLDKATAVTSCNPCPTGTYSGVVGCCSWDPSTYLLDPVVNPHPSSTCKECPIGTYNSGTGASACTPCPAVCYGGPYNGRVCYPRDDPRAGAAAAVRLSADDLRELGGPGLLVNGSLCVTSGGTCRDLTTALVGATNPNQCELDREPIPMDDGGARPAPYTMFDNTLYTKEHPDSPRTRRADQTDSYSSANAPTVFGPPAVDPTA